ncbi:MAG: hypothetical protein ACFB12_08770 [Leptolyngbyaceae cyanobacterium]
MEIAIVIVAIVVAFLVFTWLIKVMRATFRTALLVALILLALQLIFGIGPQALWENLQNWLSGSGQ